MVAAPERFRSTARAMVEDSRNELILSAASTWEIAIKVGIGTLTLPGPVETVVPEMIAASGVSLLAVGHHHTLRVAALPPHHRDPFDRLLVAQAQLEDVPVMTADEGIGAYDVDVRQA